MEKESSYKEGMTWGNHGKFGWHIDHIKAVSKFNFINEDGSVNVEEVKKCMCLTKLQPLWCYDNLVKRMNN